jgi:hypothetical protein
VSSPIPFHPIFLLRLQIKGDLCSNISKIGDRVRVSRDVGSRYPGKLGVVLDIERDPKGRPDWDICAVYFGFSGTHHFASVQIEKVEFEPIDVSKAA